MATVRIKSRRSRDGLQSWSAKCEYKCGWVIFGVASAGEAVDQAEDHIQYHQDREVLHQSAVARGTNLYK